MTRPMGSRELVKTLTNELNESQRHITELKTALEQFANVAEALIENPSGINWSALQHNAIEARRLLLQQANEGFKL